MGGQEKQRATHLVILFVYTIATIVLMGEAFVLEWDKAAILLLLIGVAGCWGIHITGKIPEDIRIWIYFVLTMMAFFYYGIHETSLYDLAPVMIVVMIIYSETELNRFIQCCMATYYITMVYDFIFLQSGLLEFSPLVITRTGLHFLIIYLAGKLIQLEMQRRRKEREGTDDKIAELEEVNRKTEDFLTNVSHELRTPINAVAGITSVMLKNEENIAKRKDLLSIQAAGRRLIGQIGDILDYTEIDTGRLKVSESNYMISSLINDIITGSRMEQREKNLELIFDIDAGIPSVLLGDEKKIKRILAHLIDNAYKFTKKGGIYVRIYALRKDYGINLCIKVSDTGIGMTQEEIEKNKERFHQSNSGRNRKAGGLGLGLPIVYGLVSAMEGFMQIESAEGEGTTVSVSIPQKVLDEKKCMTLENQKDLCLACYLKPEKYETPEVRNYYWEMISHMVRELEMALHRVSDMEELRKLTTVYQLTHLFLGREEYEENRAYFEDLCQNMQVVVIANDDFVCPPDSRVNIILKPFYGLAFVNLLNVRKDERELLYQNKYMICPGIRVLVVDDEPMNLMVAEGVFNDYQMIVTTADSGKKAIKLCQENEYDLIFLDHMMPEMDGVETLKYIRKIDADTGRTSTVIAFTANAVSGAREMFLKEGFHEFLSKPIETLELERILRKVLPKSSIDYVDEKNRTEKKKGERKKKAPQNDVVIDLPIEEDHQKETMKRLETIGIHTSSGMEYCRNDEEFYGELLMKFAKDAKKKMEEMERDFQQEDPDNYRIRVHALKSTAKMVGADKLSEHAKQAEMAAKGRDTDYIRKHHGQLMEEYHQMVQSISEIFELGENDHPAEKREDAVEISQDELISLLTELKNGLDTFEADKAESLLAKMNVFVYQGTPMDQLLSEIRQDVEDFEFFSAAEKVEGLLAVVRGGEGE